MNWINPEQNLVGAVKQIQDIMQGIERPTDNDNNYTIEQVKDAGLKVGISDDECKTFYDFYNSQGWCKSNGLPISNLPSQLANWKKNGHKFEPKEDKDEFIRKVMKDVADRDRREGKGIMAEVNRSGNITPDKNPF